MVKEDYIDNVFAGIILISRKNPWYHYLSRATSQSIQKRNLPEQSFEQGFHLPIGYNYCNKNLLKKMYENCVQLFFKMPVGERCNKSFMITLILLFFCFLFKLSANYMKSIGFYTEEHVVVKFLKRYTQKPRFHFKEIHTNLDFIPTKM